MISPEDFEEFVNDKKSHALEIIEDLVSDYLYYNRKEDEDLSRKDMEQLITSGDLTAGELVDRFRTEIVEGIEVVKAIKKDESN